MNRIHSRNTQTNLDETITIIEIDEKRKILLFPLYVYFDYVSDRKNI